MTKMNLNQIQEYKLVESNLIKQLLRIKKKKSWPLHEPVINAKSINHVKKCLNSTWVSTQGEYVKKFEKDGLDERKIKMTIKNLQIANNSLEHYKNVSKKKYIRKLSNGLSIVSNNIFLSEPDETVFRVLGEILKEVSGKYYPPRGKDLVNLMKKTQNKNFTKATLGGCIIERVHDSLLIKKELKI